MTAIFNLKYRILFLSLLHFSFISTNLSQRQNYQFENLNLIQALPDSRKVIQDKDGYLWLATHEGIWKFDGYSFENIRFSPKGQSGLSGNIVSELMEDSKGRLWVACINTGIDISNQFKNSFSNLNQVLELKTQRIFTLLEDSNHNIWIGGNSGLELIKEIDNHLFKIDKENTLISFLTQYKEMVIYKMVEDANGNIWVGTSIGLVRYNPSEDAVAFLGAEAGLRELPVVDMGFYRNQELWISEMGMPHPFSVLDIDSDKFKLRKDISIDNPNARVWFTFDANNRIWFAPFGSGCIAYNLNTRQVDIRTRENSNLSYTRFIRAPFCDRSGNIYITGDGLYKYPFDRGFKNYTQQEKSIQSNSAIFINDEALLAGFREVGLVKYHLAEHSEELIIDPEVSSAYPKFDPITNIQSTKDGQFIVVGVDGFHILNEAYNLQSSVELSGSNRYAFQDREEDIWIAAQIGLVSFDPGSNNLTIHKPPMLNGRWPYFQTIVQDKEGLLWIASDGNGLFSFDKATGNFIQYGTMPDSSKSLPSNHVADLAIDFLGNLWVASDRGLILFNQEDGHQLFGRESGIHNENIASIVVENQEAIWVSTSDGVSRFDITESTFTNFNKGDGLINSFYYPRVRYKYENYIYFGGRHGIDYFSPEELNEEYYLPNIVIEQIEAGTSNVLLKEDFKNSSLLRFPYSTDFYTISFTGMNFPIARDIRYAYKMSGIVAEWTSVSDKREIVFSQLRPGSYTFEVKAFDPQSPHKEALSQVSFEVIPPYWMRWEFIVGLILLSGFLLYQLVTYRERKISVQRLMQTKMNQQIQELEKQALLSQMNPHFIFNAINSIQEFILEGDRKSAMFYLSQFSRLVRSVLQYSSQKRIPLSDEIALIKDYLALEQLRFPDKFDYEIQVSQEVDIHTMEIPPFLIQPQIENAIRHGFSSKKEAGHLTISFSRENEILKIAIIDDGVGRAVSRGLVGQVNNGAGLGLSITRQRIELIRRLDQEGDFQIVDLISDEGEAAGTKVLIELPID